MTLLVLPHWDIHLALDDASRSSVDFKLFHQVEIPNADQYLLSDLTSVGNYLTFSPYEATGSRLDSHVTVNIAGNIGTITGDSIGTTFIVMKGGGMYTVVRVQVHQSMVGWWFGNPSITTAVDPNVGHAQAMRCFGQPMSNAATPVPPAWFRTDRVASARDLGSRTAAW